MDTIVWGAVGVVVVAAVAAVVHLRRQREQQKRREAERLAAQNSRGRRRRSSKPISDTVEPMELLPDSRQEPVMNIEPLALDPQQEEHDVQARRQAVEDVNEATSHDPVSALRAALDHENTYELLRQGPEKRVEPLILIVDDSKSALLSATRSLRGLPYRLVTAENGLVALSKLEQEKPALVITDVDMPQLDGFGLLRRMRNDLRFNDVPVIMVTGHLHMHVQIGASEGVNGFLSKPYAPTDLVDQVAYLLTE